MFKRKKKKTGVQTPEFRKPSAPPPPPTSGSNARKPNPNYVPPASVIVNCGHQPTHTSTQNPPDTLSSLLKATSVQILPNDISTATYICPYETPCGWCTKWDKKCDKKIEPEIVPILEMPDHAAEKFLEDIKNRMYESCGVSENLLKESKND